MSTLKPGLYRKRPVCIEAVRAEDDNWADMALWAAGTLAEDDRGRYMIIHTLEGDMNLRQGDWLIRGLAGEFYPCADDIFLKSYETAMETTVSTTISAAKATTPT